MREQIVLLGQALKAEQSAGCCNTCHPAGLATLLAQWRMNVSHEILALPDVQTTFTLLHNYADHDPPQRAENLSQAIKHLRLAYQALPKEGAAEQSAPPAPTPPPRPTTATQRAIAAKTSPRPTPSATTTRPQLDDDLKTLAHIGPRLSGAFKRLGVRTVRDLLYHFPHRYDDYSAQKGIAELQIGANETVVAEVSDVRTFSMRSGGRGVEVLVNDETGALKLVFFQQPWIVNQLPIGRKIVISGKVASYQGLRQMTSPDWEPFANDELIHTGRLVPVHPLTKGLIEKSARTIIKQVVDLCAPLLPDHIPVTVRTRANLLPLSAAITNIHFPTSKEQLEHARLRLGFDEFFLIQLGILQRRALWQGELGHALTINSAVHEDLRAQLPFQFTGAQVRAIDEIFADLQRAVPMGRLLQGDVGSGKTVVAAAALLQAIANGCQGALMAPTEILAEQHYKGLKQLLAKIRVPRRPTKTDDDWKHDLAPEAAARFDEIKRILGMTGADDMGDEGIRIALLTGSLGAKERRRVLQGIANGEVDLIIGTHALITEGVQYQSLGLICIDEQHRFGVEQRQRLKNKGFNPHMLVMTATPIPRTLTLTIYGDLDVSILDELPPGRQSIRTKRITRTQRDKAYRHMRKEIEKGRQAFVICPLVEESEKIDLPSAEEMYAQLQSEIFPDLRVGLIHGRLLPKEKDEVMVAFSNQEFHILVATAVVEVGIDIPNATIIMIEGAERFGLAQLHQFRGRVGRGSDQSYCILVSDRDNDQTKQRLEALEQTTDGFKLAEIDLTLRGPGQFFGTRQSGTPDLKIAGHADTRLLYAARSEAQKLLTDDPTLARDEHALLRTMVETFWAKTEGAS